MVSPIDPQAMRLCIDNALAEFDAQRIELLHGVSLDDLLPRNPYLYVARNVRRDGATLIANWLDAWLFAAEDALFNKVMVQIIQYLAAGTSEATRSPAAGIDLEIRKDDVNFCVCVCSKSLIQKRSQRRIIDTSLKNAIASAVQIQKTSSHAGVLGIFDGRPQKKNRRDYLELAGEDFWEFVCGEREAGENILTTLDHRSMEIDSEFPDQKAHASNRLTRSFIDTLCNSDGSINWARVARGAI